VEFCTFEVDGPVEIKPRKIGDDRGYFSEIFRMDNFRQHTGEIHFVQENQSFSAGVGTLRGIHFQSRPAAQGKLVRCVTGRLLDVAVDLRSDSPTFGRWVSAVLSADELNQLWVPVGFGHGFCTLEPNTVVSYRVTDYYSPQNDLGVRWDDPDIGIPWPDVANPDTLSVRDRRQPSFADLPPYFSVKDS
jgi:dTDP-4-dehydrorhamnose 3,5-epimerase